MVACTFLLSALSAQPGSAAAPLHFNGPNVFGVRPGSPLLYRIAAVGHGPIVYSAENLPAGLVLDSSSGIISGALPQAGDYHIRLRIRDGDSEQTRILLLKVGTQLALTPPMGWNSWYCWSESVSQKNVAVMAHAMAEKLAAHGWSYINIDDCWQGARGGKFGAIQPNEKFPDMGALGQEIHALGLKFGIYSTPWMGSYAGFIGGSAPNAEGDYATLSPVPLPDRKQPGQIFGSSPGSALRQAQQIGAVQLTDRDAQQYAAWGVDYIKYDWKNSTFSSRPLERPIQRQEHPKSPESIIRLEKELRSVPRDILLSLSPMAEWEARETLVHNTQLWRITKDIKADWASLNHVFDLSDWLAYAGPGHWPDLDMLQVGSFGVVNALNRTLRPSPLTQDEQRTQMSFWCLASAPLLLSCDLTVLDDFTLDLITNDEVIALDQDALGQAARRVYQEGSIEAWKKTLADGSFAVGIFNRGDRPAKMVVRQEELGLKSSTEVRDLWTHQTRTNFVTENPPDLPAHGVLLVSYH